MKDQIQQAKRIWFTADPHWGHKNIIEYCGRPFENVAEMNFETTKRWNDVVKEDDDIFILGDVTLGSDLPRYLNPLKGNIYIVPGSHDWRWMKNIDVRYFEHPPRQGTVNLLPSLYSLQLKELGRLPIVLCHYAMRVWDRSHHGSLHLFGHSHGRLENTERSMDVGVDSHNFYPVSLEQVLAVLK